MYFIKIYTINNGASKIKTHTNKWALNIYALNIYAYLYEL